MTKRKQIPFIVVTSDRFNLVEDKAVEVASSPCIPNVGDEFLIPTDHTGESFMHLTVRKRIFVMVNGNVTGITLNCD